MKNYNLKHIVEIVSGQLIGDDQTPIEQIFFDSRLIVHPVNGIFFAFSGNQKNGHSFIADAYHKGIRNFVVTQPIQQYNNINQIIVDNPLQALQQWAKYHRNQFNLPVIGITGSN